ncbi:MAG: aminoglycoside phosphotransferase family protein [Saprospiraceae bacterium]|nr:aminoglycoside phosphotransferase family protein [Saprospiraceae bacterium]
MMDEPLLDLFNIDPVPEPLRFGNGLINETYLVYRQGQKNLLQKINHNVFKDVGILMENLQQVCDHVNSKFPEEPFISVVPTRTGAPYAEVNGNYWRMLKFIPDTHSYESLSSPYQAYEAGKVIGHFHVLLGDMELTGIRDTIPQFHDLEFRINQFHQAVGEDRVNRAKDCKDDIRFLLELTQDVLTRQLKANQPLRVVHNDTKLNNILFDAGDKGICMVDLDTVMQGYIIYDTGDALRTLCNPAGEDGRQGILDFNRKAYQKFIEGYLNASRGFLTEGELRLIPFSIIRMSTEQCIRFLSDHLNGDIYFHQPYPGFNLNAARNQIRFIHLTQKNESWMEKVLSGFIRRFGS